MTTYYISPAGSDSNNGLGPDASNPTNKPWATIGKALGVGGLASGDTAYIAPGVYRQQVTLGTTYTVMTYLLGDPQNGQGFKNASGLLLQPDYVRWTGWDGASDVVAPTGTNPTLTLGSNGFLTLQYLLIVAGNGLGDTVISGLGTHDFSILDCVILSGSSAGGQLINVGSTPYGAAANILMDRCAVISFTSGIAFMTGSVSGTGADWNMNVVIRNSLLFAPFAASSVIYMNSSGGLANHGGGMTVQNCMLIGGATPAVKNFAGTWSTTYPCAVQNCVVLGGLSAGTTGYITMDGSYQLGGNNTNVTPTNSPLYTTVSNLFELVQSFLWGFAPRPLMAPMRTMSWGGTSNLPGVDFLNRPRPEGGPNNTQGAYGYLERHDTGAQEAVTVQGGSSSMRLAAQASQEFQVAVDPIATTISIYSQVDAAYGTASPPQLQLVANPSLGIAGQVVTAPANTGQWNQLTLAPFTPTAKGIVKLRALARGAAGNAYFDTMVIA